ncbi:unnamed protein product [Ilex paraguariensis]|uniref:Uncharacterized protein n=1 Tax=Ilex paraguariensis TaxID=185542 RepID=A0ABC8U703_9AQUA
MPHAYEKIFRFHLEAFHGLRPVKHPGWKMGYEIESFEVHCKNVRYRETIRRILLALKPIIFVKSEKQPIYLDV